MTAMVVTTRGISKMKLEDVDAQLQGMGWWKPEAGMKRSLPEKKSVLRELRGKIRDPIHHVKRTLPQKRVLHEILENTRDAEGHQHLAKKNKEELNNICTELNIPLTGNETKPHLTRKIKEKRESPADLALVDFGKHCGRTYDWVWCYDQSYCLWATDTVVEVGDKSPPSLRRLAEYVENRRQLPLPATSGGASASTSAAPASRPATLSTPTDTVEDPEAEIEKLQRHMEELRSQLSSRRR